MPLSSRCPICSKPATPGHTPFCSTRCQELDLHRWFSGLYAVPVVEEEENPDDEEER